MKLKTLLITFAIALIISILSIFFLLKRAEGPSLGGDFILNHQNQEWTFSDHAKPLNILYFGYAKCPDVCPFSLTATAEAFKKLNSTEKEKVQVVFISVDSAHDTAESVAIYASAFDPSFVGLTGPETEINKTAALFGASYMYEKTQSYLGYTISHSDRLFFLNKKGTVIDSLSHPRNPKEIIEKIKEHL